MLTTKGNLKGNVNNATSTKKAVIRLTAAGLAVTGWLGVSLPSVAINISTNVNQTSYRNCVTRLRRAEVGAPAAARACAGALNPSDLGSCVLRIKGQTEIAADDALANCRQSRRPLDVSRCVVGISNNTQNQAVPGLLDYCSRSLLPVNFAECVVGLRREINIAPTQALENCIYANDRPLTFDPAFIPAAEAQQPLPAPAPTAPENQTPPAQLTPTTPENQPAQPTPQK